MPIAFRHTETGAICIPSDSAGYGAPDWEPLPSAPDAPGPWDWNGEAWVRNTVSALAVLRAERNARLAACDWTQMRDQTPEIAQLWAPYRQALRNMPETADPFDPVWPETP